jgi:hypothetical protein
MVERFADNKVVVGSSPAQRFSLGSGAHRGNSEDLGEANEI